MPCSKHIEDIRALAEKIGRDIRLMEVCGTHTMAAFRSGLRSLLPVRVSLISGPGCPVCVTPDEFVDRAIALARRTDVEIATFGDFLRVPGTESSLERERALGADVRVVYSVIDALALAKKSPERKIVFPGIGFETTAPTVAWAIRRAAREGLGNFFVLSAHRTMSRAMAELLEGGESAIDGFMCPGHVSAVIGTRPYEFIAKEYHVPCVVAGFEHGDILEAIGMLLRQVAEGRAEVENQYVRAVSAGGNAEALTVMNEVFEPCDAEWRGLGVIKGSALAIRGEYGAHDAQAVMAPRAELGAGRKKEGCICGEILRGVKTPKECRLFRRGCTPETPVGACMVSSEGACAAYYRYASE